MFLNIVFFLVNILILSVIYLFLRRRIDRLTDTKRLSDGLAGDLDIILSEINQATERNVMIIEDKIRALEDIISTAEKRITLLKKTVSAEADAKVPSPPPKKPKKPEMNTEEIDGSGNVTENQLLFEIPSVDEKKDSAAELTYSHLNRMNAMTGMVTSLKVPEKEPAQSESIKEKVIRLHRSGIDPQLIASNAGINRGEVELIISLYTQIGNGQEEDG